MKNTLPNKMELVFALAEEMADGLNLYGSDAGVMLITEAIMRNAIVTTEAAVRGYDEARVAVGQAYAAYANADQLGRQFLLTTRNVLVLDLGTTYSDQWAATGFPDQSTAVPISKPERQTVLRALQNYFANHSTRENPGRGVTAVQAGIRFNAVSDAKSAVNVAILQARAAKKVRDAAIADLRRKMRGCIDELSQLLDDDDDRWYAFGLNPPAAPETPEIPEGLVLSIAGPGAVNSNWGDAPRADRYRVFKQVVGVDAEPVPVETVYDTQFAFTGLTSGQTLKVFVSAGNDAGVSDLSEAAEIVVG